MAKDAKSDESPRPKIGDGHASAMARQGLAELRGAFFNESNVAQPPMAGLYGTPTQGEVAAAREVDDEAAAKVQELNEEPKSILGGRLQEAAARDVRGRDERSMERE